MITHQMSNLTSLRQRLGASVLAMLLLVLAASGIVVDCAPGCCERDEVTIARLMDCCEPTMEARDPSAVETVPAARVHAQSFTLAPREIAAVDVHPPRSSSETTHRPLHRRTDAAIFLLNAQFLI